MKNKNFTTVRLPLLWALLGGVAVLVITLLLHASEQTRTDHARRSQLSAVAAIRAQQIQGSLVQGMAALDSMAVMLINSNYNTADFEAWARALLHQNSALSVVQLAPDGIVALIAPLAGNEGAIGHDLLKDQRRSDGALRAIQARASTFIGPLRLIQNGKMAVIARKPVFLGEAADSPFWGFCIAIIQIEKLLPEGLFDDTEIAYRLLGEDPDGSASGEELVIAATTDAPLAETVVSYPVIVPNGRWILKLAYRQTGFDSTAGWPILAGGGLTSLLVFLLIFALARRMLLRQAEIERLNRELSRANSAKDQLFKIIAHDLKTPFSALLYYFEECPDQLDCEDPLVRRKLLGTLKQLILNTYTLLENLLQWARANTGGLKPEPAAIDTGQLIQEALSHVEDSVTAKQLQIKAGSEERLTVLADTNMVQTILRNLLVNAVKYSRPGGTVQVEARCAAGMAELCVRDNGVGLTAGELDRLFRLDSAGSKKGTAGETGTGLGLLLCQELVRLNGGSIWAESSPGAGSRFCVRLPLAPGS